MKKGSNPRRSLDGERFDVAVIGGGINGVAIARQCAAAGRRTLLVEKNDFASGTTSRSTRIIHGGLRYLEHGEIALVRESLRERERLLRTKPHLVRRLRFLLALPPGRRSALEVRFGLWLYRRFAGTNGSGRNGHDLGAFNRLLDHGERWHLFQYDDAQCEFPERLVAEWLVEALCFGAEPRNYTEALQVEVAEGRVRGLRLRDRLTNSEFRVAVPLVVNASGPWADAVALAAGIAAPRMVGGVRGSHLVLSRFAGAPETAVYTEAVDGRPIFVIPWNNDLLVGTTEVDDSGDPSRAQPTEGEIEYLLASVRRLFPAAGSEHVRYAMAGVRPLPFSPGNPMAAITRRHLLHDHAPEGASGMISVIGGKLTTAASLARDCANAIGIEATVPEADTALVRADIDRMLARYTEDVAACAGIAPPRASVVVSWFGRAALPIAQAAAKEERLRRPLCDGSPHMVAEAVHALRKETAVTLADVLLRRVPVALAGGWTQDQTRQAAKRIGAAMNWSESRIATEAEQFEEERQRFAVRVKERATA